MPELPIFIGNYYGLEQCLLLCFTGVRTVEFDPAAHPAALKTGFLYVIYNDTVCSEKFLNGTALL